MSTWSLSARQRHEIRRMVACEACDALAGAPCLRLRGLRAGQPYRHYVHAVRAVRVDWIDW